MDDIKLSIIVPAYNLEQYIEQCINSIGAIDDHITEIILVDDGSKDHTPNICDELASKKSGIRVIHQTNSGAAVTRNTGMRVARGSFLMFVDGDDFLNPGAVQKVLALLSDNLDIICFNKFTEFYGNNDAFEQKHLNEKVLIDRNGDVSEDTFQLVSPLPMPWLYVIKKDYITTNNIYMTPGLLDEDEEWTARLFACQPKVKVIQDGYYMYRRNRENSLTFGRALKNSLADIEIIKLLQKESTEKNYSITGKRILDNKCRQMVNKVLDDLPRLSKEDAKIANNMVKPYRYLLKSGTRAQVIHYYFDSVLGRKNTSKLISKVISMRK